MSSIIGKTINGQTYYAREVARVGDKPKIVSQRYLGNPADTDAAIAGTTMLPGRTRHLAFGDGAAVWEMLRRLRVAEIVNEVLGARRSDAGASVGTYIALATLNRVVEPPLEARLLRVVGKDRRGPLRAPFPRSARLDHRRFWEAMDAVSEKDLVKIERRIVAAMVERLEIDLSGLVLDMTHFAT